MKSEFDQYENARANVHSCQHFVPDSWPNRFAKPTAKGGCAGVTVINQEDAVPLDDKDSARVAAIVEKERGSLNNAAGIADLHHFMNA